MTSTMRRRSRELIVDLRAVVVPWLTARLLIAAGFVVAHAASDHLVDGSPSTLTEGLIAWDGTWYRDIAAHGYQAVGVDGVRFFPLFPLAGRLLSVVTFGRTDVALIVLANVASLLLLIAVRRLVLLERGSKALSDRSVWLLCLFPGAFVLAWGYAEALWLLAAVIGFWAIRSRRWGLAIVAGLVLGLTRPLGVAFAAPAAIELWRVWRTARNDERALGVASVIAPIVGTGGFLLWVHQAFGDAWLPFTVQNSLRGSSSDPITRIWNGLGDLFGAQRFGDGLHIPFAIAFVVLLVLTFRWWPVSYGVFAAIILTAALAAENLNSLERYGLNAFPIVLSLAVLVKDPRVERPTMIVLGGGMVALTTLAWIGAYVP